MWDWAVLGVAGYAVFCLGRRRVLSSFDVLLLVVTAYFAFHARRDAWFLLLASLPIVTDGPTSAVAEADRFPVTLPRALVLAIAAVVIALGVGWKRNLSEAGLEGRVAAKYPSAAAAFVEEQGYGGPLYNHFNWGGYLTWRLPTLPVAMDGRTNLHGDARIYRFEATWTGQRGWDADPELAAANVVIAETGMPLNSLLRYSPRFQLVYSDAVAEVFMARHAAR
jgi:hypothetical protein